MKKLFALLLVLLLPVTAMAEEWMDFASQATENGQEVVTEVTMEVGGLNVPQGVKDLLNAVTLVIHETDFRLGVEALVNGSSAGRAMLGITEDELLLTSDYLGDRVLALSAAEMEELFSGQMDSEMAYVQVEGFAFTAEQLADPEFMEKLTDEGVAWVEEAINQLVDGMTLYSSVEESQYYDPAACAFVAELKGEDVASLLELDSFKALMTTLYGEEKATESQSQMTTALRASDLSLEMDLLLDENSGMVMLYLDGSESGYDMNFTLTRTTQEGIAYYSWYGEMGMLQADGSVAPENTLYGSYYMAEDEENFYTILDSYEEGKTEAAEEITLILGQSGGQSTFEIDFQKGESLLGYGGSGATTMVNENTRATTLVLVELVNDKQTTYTLEGTTTCEEDGVMSDWALSVDSQALPVLTLHTRTTAQEKSDFFALLEGENVMNPLSMTALELTRLNHNISISAAVKLASISSLLPESFIQLLGE